MSFNMATKAILFLPILCLMHIVNIHAAKGKIEDHGTILLQRQFNEFKTQQKVAEKLSDARIKLLEDLVSSQFQTIRDQEDRLSRMESKLDAHKRLVLDSGLAESGRVAFSAYLDHDLDGVTNLQKIVFNQPNYNDGDFYDVSTGVFTAPVQGVYLFIYFVGNRHAREVDAELVVNGVKQNEAVAEGVGDYHDTQGGNSAILKLVAGDEVWIDTTLGSHVEGQWRFSSFTGAMLYPLY